MEYVKTIIMQKCICNFVIGASDMLLIQPVTRSKAGKYYCEVQAIDDKTREVIEMKRTTDCELEIMDEILPQLSSQ